MIVVAMVGAIDHQVLRPSCNTCVGMTATVAFSLIVPAVKLNGRSCLPRGADLFANGVSAKMTLIHSGWLDTVYILAHSIGGS